MVAFVGANCARAPSASPRCQSAYHGPRRRGAHFCHSARNNPNRRFRRNLSARLRCAAEDSLSLYDLRVKLDAAVKCEDYVTAAQLRDLISDKELDARLAVEYANNQFYRAFQNGSVDQMRGIWGKGDHVQCIHPTQDCVAGDEMVLQSWAVVLSSVLKGDFQIVLENVRVHVSDKEAYVTCVEIVKSGRDEGRLIATNLFQKQDGEWRIVHHHASPCGAL